MSTVERDARRVLAAIYRLSKGVPGTVVTNAELYAEIDRERLLDCSDAEFEEYKRKSVAEARAWRSRHSN